MLAASIRVYPLVAVLVCCGLFSVLILRRVFKLDKALDDPARIAATRSLIVDESKQETSWDGRAYDAVGHLIGEVVVWGIFGFLYLAVGESAFLLGFLILFGGLILYLVLQRVSKLDIKALVGHLDLEAAAATALGLLTITAICLACFFLMQPQTQSAQSMPALSLSHRNDVVQIQQRLIELGFLPSGFFPEGNWGPISQQALLEFKKQSGLGSSKTWNSTAQRSLFSKHATRALSHRQ